jgi:hypothetical protein
MGYAHSLVEIYLQLKAAIMAIKGDFFLFFAV